MSTRQNGPPHTAPLPSSMADSFGCAQNTPPRHTPERGAKWQAMVHKQWFAISGYCKFIYVNPNDYGHSRRANDLSEMVPRAIRFHLYLLRSIQLTAADCPSRGAQFGAEYYIRESRFRRLWVIMVSALWKESRTFMILIEEILLNT